MRVLSFPNGRSAVVAQLSILSQAPAFCQRAGPQPSAAPRQLLHSLGDDPSPLGKYGAGQCTGKEVYLAEGVVWARGGGGEHCPVGGSGTGAAGEKLKGSAQRGR